MTRRPPRSEPPPGRAADPHDRRDPLRTRIDSAGLSLAERGELAAARALAARGLRPVAWGLRTRAAEIDLLARHRRLWIAVEVKTRRTHPAPERCVSRRQLERLRAALVALAPALHPAPRLLRVDVAAVRPERDGDGRSPAFEVLLVPGAVPPWRP